jgi:HD-like signal output (HDOD) protein
VLQLADNNETGLDELAVTISKDPALSVKVLKAVNSSFYGLQQKVSALNQAVALLGLHSVKTLVLGFTLLDQIRSRRSKGFNHLQYWRRTVYAATAARVIAQSVMPTRMEDCFIAALLMDLGALVLDQVLGEPYADLHGRARTHSDLLVLETHALGMTHAEAGGLLAQHWKLPPLLEAAMAHHHGPQAIEDVVDRKIVQIVHLAGQCADVFVNDDPAATIAAVRRTFLEQHKIREVAADAILVEIGQRTTQLAPLFEVKLNAAQTYESILEKASEKLLELQLAEQADAAPVNRRRAARIRRDGHIRIIPCANGVLSPPIPVRLKDLSSTGIGVLHTQPLPLGTQFVVQLPQPGGQTKHLLYRVVRCETAAGIANIGAELASVLKPEAVNAALPAAEPTGADLAASGRLRAALMS